MGWEGVRSEVLGRGLTGLEEEGKSEGGERMGEITVADGGGRGLGGADKKVYGGDGILGGGVGDGRMV